MDPPDYCTEWNVRAVVAHLAGACAAFTKWEDFKRQFVQNPYMTEFDQKVDGVNKRQLEDRAERTLTELVEEFRVVAPAATRTRQRLPWLLRRMRVPFGPPLGTTSVEYLTDLIYTRDQWMHRYDICAATGKEMVVTPDHDGRIVALVVRDVANKLRHEIGNRTVIVTLVGKLSASYRFGPSDNPGCRIELDVFDFNLLASGRVALSELRPRIAISGDERIARWFLQNVEVPY